MKVILPTQWGEKLYHPDLLLLENHFEQIVAQFHLKNNYLKVIMTLGD
jgi:hypothetical protein